MLCASKFHGAEAESNSNFCIIRHVKKNHMMFETFPRYELWAMSIDDRNLNPGADEATVEETTNSLSNY
jgi:hypothetical protein